MRTVRLLETLETPLAPERRRARRHRVMLSARLLSPAGPLGVVLLDLSNEGAMISAPLPLPQGSHVVLTRGRLEAHAVVAWAEGRRLGLEFDEPIPDAVIDGTLSAAPRMAH